MGKDLAPINHPFTGMTDSCGCYQVVGHASWCNPTHSCYDANRCNVKARCATRKAGKVYTPYPALVWDLPLYLPMVKPAFIDIDEHLGVQSVIGPGHGLSPIGAGMHTSMHNDSTILSCITSGEIRWMKSVPGALC